MLSKRCVFVCVCVCVCVCVSIYIHIVIESIFNSNNTAGIINNLHILFVNNNNTQLILMTYNLYLYQCMYVCMYVCVYVCMYLSVYVCAYYR